VAAKLISAKVDKKAVWESLTNIFKDVYLTDAEIERTREERILG